MLNTVYKQALENRRRMLDLLSGRGDIVARAQSRWNVYEPEPAPSPRTLGVDGSHNTVHYQGVDLWVAMSVAARPDGDVAVTIPARMGLGRNVQLPDIMQGMEIEACEASVEMAELVLMDGSLRAALLSGDGGLRARLLPLVSKHADRIAFVSKTSDVSLEFGDMASVAGDIYYYNKASHEPGFSDMVVRDAPGGGPPISSTYARLARYAPLVKLEVLGDAPESEIRGLIGRLARQSVGGYPNALMQAHNLCTITNDDMRRIETIMGINDTPGAREVLQ